MHARKQSLTMFACGLVLITAAATSAQTPPERPDRSDITAPELSSAQVEKVRSFVTYWMGQMSGTEAKPANVLAARQQLLGVLTTLGISPHCRFTFAQEAAPVLRDTIDAGNALGVSNAFIVLSFIRNDQAMELALDYADVRQEDRAHVRQMASRAVQVLLRDGRLDPAQSVGYVRRLREAAEHETSNLALRYQLASLAMIGEPSRDPNVNIDDTARTELAAAMDEVVRTISEQDGQTPCELVDAYRLGVREYLEVYIKLDQAEQERLGRQLSPTLGRFLEAVGKHWAGAQHDNGWKTMYAAAIEVTESLLTVIDQRVRRGSATQSPNAHDAWEAGDKPAYERGVQSWLQIHSAYGG